MMLSMAVQVLLAFIYFGSTAAFNAFSGVGVITLTLSYVVPIIASVIDGRKQIKEGSFYLGALGVFANWVSISKTFPANVVFLSNNLYSLVRLGHSAFLHAYLPPCHP
jgi:hypothetical protein